MHEHLSSYNDHFLSCNQIELFFDWDNKCIIIADNGEGMNKEVLLDSMKIGSSDPNKERAENDLGRFGMGMKTAAFSLAQKLLVISKQDGICAHAAWDLEYVDKTDKSPGFKFAEAEVNGIPVRIEVGARDLENNQITFARRDTSEKISQNAE